MIKHRLFLGLTAMCLLLCLTGCSQSKEPTILDFGGNQAPQQGSETHLNTETTQPDKNIPVGYTYTPGLSGLVSGQVSYTVTGVRVVTHQDDIPNQGGFIVKPAVFQKKDGGIQDYSYPEFIHEDGSFIEDCYLILVDITIRSDDAVWNTDRKTGGQFEDPYMFRANRITLADMTDKDSDGFYAITPTDYFSGKCEESEEAMDAIRLEPGEEKTYTFGYFIGGYKSDGTKTDLSQLCLCNTYGDPDSVLIRLGLEG